MSASEPSAAAGGVVSGAARPRAVRVLSVMPGRPEGHNMVFAREASRALRARGVEVEEFFVESRTSPRALWHDWRRLRALVLRGDFDALLLATNGVAQRFGLIGSDLNLCYLHLLASKVGMPYARIIAPLQALRLACLQLFL